MVTEEAAPNTPKSAASSASNGVFNSPQRRQNLPSPWASVVRGDKEQVSSPTAPDSSPPPEQASASDTPSMENLDPEVQAQSSDVNGDGNAGGSRKPAWNRPLNGVVEAGPVMGGAVSWPALSESTRAVPRSLSDSTRPVADRSVSSSEITANTSSHTHSAANNTVPARPKSRNRGGSGGRGSSSRSGPSQNNFNRPTGPMPPPFPVFEVPYKMVPPTQDTPITGPRPAPGTGGFQPHTGNDNSSQRNTSRRGNYGPRPRGDGQNHNNHGGRRDHVHLPPQYVPPPMGGYLPPPLPHGAGPFVAPPQMRVFPGQMGFDIAPPLFYVPPMHPDSFMAMPLVSTPLPMPFPPVNENLLTNMIVKQIDYYFSDENLDKDDFLKSHMDGQGWAPVALIASFRRVQRLTKDISEILEALRFSTVVEIQGDKLRRRDDWNRWLVSSDAHNVDSGSRTPVAATENVLETSVQQVSLNDSMTNGNDSIEASRDHTDTATGKVLREETTSQSRLSNGGETEFH